MYYFAIFVALLSTFVNSSADLHGSKTRAGINRFSLCDSRHKDRNAEKQQHKSQNNAEDLSDELLRELALKKVLSIASSGDRSKIAIKQKGLDFDALAKFEGDTHQIRTAQDEKKSRESANDQRESSKLSVAEKSPRASEGLQNEKINEEVVDEPIKNSARQHRVVKSLHSNRNVNSSIDRKAENTIKTIANATEKNKEGSGDVDKNSKKRVSQRESPFPAMRLFEPPESSENLNNNKNVNINKNVNVNQYSRDKGGAKFRSLQNDESSADRKYNPPPYVQNRSNAITRRNNNVNRNKNVNSNKNVNRNENVNEMLMENEAKLKNRNKKVVQDRGNEDGTDSHNTEKKRPPKIVESVTTSGSPDSVHLKDVEEVTTSPLSESLEDSQPKKHRKHHKGKGRGRGHGKRYKTTNQREQRQPTEQMKNINLPDVSTMESLPNGSGKRKIENAQIPTESSSQSPLLEADDSSVKNRMSRKNAILTHLILKLLIVNTGEMSAIKTRRLKRLLNQLNADEKETILRDLEEETKNESMKVKLDENATVKRVVIRKSEPKLIIGLLARPSQDSRPHVVKEIRIVQPSNTPKNLENTKQKMEDVREKTSDERNPKKSQDLAKKSLIKVTIDNKADKKINNKGEVDESISADRLTSDKIAYVLNDPNLKAIYDATLEQLRKQAVHMDTNINSQSNVNENRRSDQTRRRMDISSAGRFYGPPRRRPYPFRARVPELDVTQDELRNHRESYGRPHPRIPELDVTLDELRNPRESYGRPRPVNRPRVPELDGTGAIEESFIPSGEDKEFNSPARNDGRYSRIPNHLNTNKNSNRNNNRIDSIAQDLDEPIDTAMEPPRLQYKLSRIHPRKRKRPAPQMNFDLVHQDENHDVNNRRLPHRSNRNRNDNRNANLNTIRAPAGDDYYPEDEVRSSRRTLGRTFSDDWNSNSNNNVNSNVNTNQNVEDHLTHRIVPRRGPRRGEVKISQETMDSILREVSQLRKQLAEKEAATNGGINVDHKRNRSSKVPNQRAYME